MSCLYVFLFRDGAICFFFFLEERWGLSSDKKADGERGDETGAAEMWSNSGGIMHMRARIIYLKDNLIILSFIRAYNWRTM